MNSKALFQLCYGPYEKIYDKIKDRYIDYAEKYGYDYILLRPKDEYISDTIKYGYKVYNKLQIFDYIDKYDWLMFIDLDIWFKKDLSDLVQYCKKGCWNQIHKTNDLYVSSLFIIDNNSIYNSIKNIDMENQMKYCSEEQYITDSIKDKVKLNFIDDHIKYYEKKSKDRFIVGKGQRYDLFHFHYFNYNNMLEMLPDIYEDLDENNGLLKKYIYIYMMYNKKDL